MTLKKTVFKIDSKNLETINKINEKYNINQHWLINKAIEEYCNKQNNIDIFFYDKTYYKFYCGILKNILLKYHISKNNLVAPFIFETIDGDIMITAELKRIYNRKLKSIGKPILKMNEILNLFKYILHTNNLNSDICIKKQKRVVFYNNTMQNGRIQGWVIDKNIFVNIIDFINNNKY